MNSISNLQPAASSRAFKAWRPHCARALERVARCMRREAEAIYYCFVLHFSSRNTVLKIRTAPGQGRGGAVFGGEIKGLNRYNFRGGYEGFGADYLFEPAAYECDADDVDRVQFFWLIMIRPDWWWHWFQDAYVEEIRKVECRDVW